jgi:hypothetical protein
MNTAQLVNENGEGKPKNSDKTCQGVPLYTINSIPTDLGLNPSRCGEKPAANRLIYGCPILIKI